MPRNVLPEVHFERGLLFRRRLPTEYGLRDQNRWLIIGKAGEIPFHLIYGSVTSWDSPARLGEPLRRKILEVLRRTCRYAAAPPSFILVHDFRALEGEVAKADETASELELGFYRFFREQYLGETPQRYIALAVPYEEKDAARALGARWDPQARVWKVRIQEDMAAFARWLPVAETHAGEPCRGTLEPHRG